MGMGCTVGVAGGARADRKLVPAAALANILIPKYLSHLHRFSHLNGCTDS